MGVYWLVGVQATLVQSAADAMMSRETDFDVLNRRHEAEWPDLDTVVR